MLDIGGGELLVIGIVALVVIGPKELPGLLRTAGNAMGKVRRMAAEFRGQFDEAMREAELEEAKKAFTSMDDTARSATTSGFNPLDTIRNEIKAVKEEMKGPQSPADAAAAPSPVVETPAPTPVVSAVEPSAPAPVVAAVETPPPPVETAPVEAAPAEEEKPKRTRKSAKAADSGNAA